MLGAFWFWYDRAAMSRGPGKWQRLILTKIAEEPRWYSFRELLGLRKNTWQDPVRIIHNSEYQAVWRAARRLAEQDKISYESSGGGGYSNGFYVGPPKDSKT